MTDSNAISMRTPSIAARRRRVRITHDSMLSRTTGAIVLRPTGNVQGGTISRTTTGKRLVGTVWTRPPMPGGSHRVHRSARRNPAGGVIRFGVARRNGNTFDPWHEYIGRPAKDEDYDPDFRRPGVSQMMSKSNTLRMPGSCRARRLADEAQVLDDTLTTMMMRNTCQHGDPGSDSESDDDDAITGVTRDEESNSNEAAHENAQSYHRQTFLSR
jgi:hypothetical protein